MGGIVWRWLCVCVCDCIRSWVGGVECEGDRSNAMMRCDGCDSGYLQGPRGSLASTRVADSKSQEKMRRQAAKTWEIKSKQCWHAPAGYNEVSLRLSRKREIDCKRSQQLDLSCVGALASQLPAIALPLLLIVWVPRATRQARPGSTCCPTSGKDGLRELPLSIIGAPPSPVPLWTSPGLLSTPSPRPL
jgi:hypothetical protein